ncbi:MAG TPA: hypothetical protein VFU55_09430 [Terracidiphilus sp.]|nr:hypothetical protein [Terracidiphilus sp.]
MKRLLWVCAGVAMTLATTMTARAAGATDVTGAWTTTVQTPNGDLELTFTFKQDGTTLTGTVQGPQGEPMEIQNGKVDGDKFTFDVSFNGMTIHHVCTADGDEIHLTSSSDNDQFPGMTMTLKREKKDAAPAPAATPAATPKGAAA